MSQTIHYPTAGEAERLSAEFDRIVQETFDELTGAGVKVRTDVIMRARDEGLSSPVRVGASLYVAHTVHDDPEIAVYDNPDDEQLREILAKAAAYSGDWFHSKVLLRFSGQWSALQTEVAELDEDSGVFLMFDYPETSLTFEGE